jgi:hypothetical protein
MMISFDELLKFFIKKWKFIVVMAAIFAAVFTALLVICVITFATFENGTGVWVSVLVCAFGFGCSATVLEYLEGRSAKKKGLEK